MNDWTELVYSEYGPLGKVIRRIIGKKLESKHGYWVGYRFDNPSLLEVGGDWPHDVDIAEYLTTRLKEKYRYQPMTEETCSRILFELDSIYVKQIRERKAIGADIR